MTVALVGCAVVSIYRKRSREGEDMNWSQDHCCTWAGCDPTDELLELKLEIWRADAGSDRKSGPVRGSQKRTLGLWWKLLQRTHESWTTETWKQKMAPVWRIMWKTWWTTYQEEHGGWTTGWRKADRGSGIFWVKFSWTLLHLPKRCSRPRPPLPAGYKWFRDGLRNDDYKIKVLARPQSNQGSDLIRGGPTSQLKAGLENIFCWRLGARYCTTAHLQSSRRED